MNINFTNDSVEPNPSIPEDQQCLLHISMSGNSSGILDRLKSIVEVMESAYKKPVQGIHCQYRCTSHVITPIWNGQEY